MISTTRMTGRLFGLVLAALLVTCANLMAQQPKRSIARLALLVPEPTNVVGVMPPHVPLVSFDEASLAVSPLAAPALSVPALPTRDYADFWGRQVVIPAPSANIVVELPDMEGVAMFEEARLAVPKLTPPVVLAPPAIRP